MRIAIIWGIKDWVIKKFNCDTWEKIADDEGFSVHEFKSTDARINDIRLNNFLNTVMKRTKLMHDSFIESFIPFWITEFTSKFYVYLAQNKNSAKEFLMSVNEINNDIAKFLPNESVIHIECVDSAPTSLTYHYQNEQVLVDVIALLRVVGKYYKTEFNIRKINNSSAEIIFNKIL